ncbi:hypothetical protein GCM10027190_57530 [Spirosoma areae]
MPGIRTFGSSDFTVELSNNGGAYYEIPSSFLTASGRFEITYQATIPANTVAGTNYRVRLVAKNPTVAGTPSPTILTIKTVSPDPTISAMSYCQGTQASQLSAVTSNGGVLSWYTSASGGGALSVGPIPATTTVGTINYYVTQTVSGSCESQRIPLPVTVKSNPAAPGLANNNVSLCQNAPPQSLTATGQNLVWYTTQNGGSGSATAPVVSTSQTGQTTYYVSQSVNGCESSRSALSVTVKGLPSVPAVANTGPTYCQNAQATALQANGQNLNWYRESSGGTSLGSSVTPDTKVGGSFTYYVSQTVDGCEGSRSSLTVKVTALPAAPSVTNAYSYCQKAPASALMATGTGLKWFEPSGNTTTTAPTPSTDNPGMMSYFVTQSTDNCESPRSEIKVTVKPTPGAPGTSAISVCQNESTRALSANGQNLLWYSTESGGTGSATSPALTTSQVGQINYYVSQSQDGCESARTTLTVTIRSLPAAPVVTTKTICQFAPPESVSALGERLTWYNTDGNKFGSAPIINTDKGASFSLLVSQTVNDCEGPKATLTVNVLTTPVPTVGKPIVEICRGATPQPLEATGTNLKWTDPNGTVSTSTPTPPTINATIKPEGDVYYVTQTGANGCESPKAAIRVFVQTPPTLAITGTTTTNLGLEVPLKLMFTGVGPYQYKLANGLSGTAIKDTTILVLPDRTTIYQVAEVSNKCGTGLPGNGATATITVLIPTIETLSFTTTTVCAGASLSTNFRTTGAFNPGSVFKLQLAKVETDTTKINFVDAANSQTSNGQMTGTIPANTPAGVYWVRVMATNPKIPINGTNSPTRLTVRALATAALRGNQTIYEGQPASLTVAFTGDGPWTFAYRDSTATGLGASLTATATTNPQVVEVRPTKTTAYLLTAVSNGCGIGTRTGSPAIVTVAPLLGLDDGWLADAVSVYPIPATATLTVHITGISPAQPALLELIDLTGRTTLRQEVRHAISSLPLDQQPSGIYLLRIRVGERTASKRVLKL